MTDETELLISRLHGVFVIPLIVLIIGILSVLLSIALQPLIIFGVPIVIIGTLMLIHAAIKVSTHNLIVTNKRVYIKTGFFSKKEEDIPFDSIDSVSVDMPLFLRIFGAGNIIIYSVGQRKLKFGPVHDPKNIRDVIIKNTHDAKNQ